MLRAEALLVDDTYLHTMRILYEEKSEVKRTNQDIYTV